MEHQEESIVHEYFGSPCCTLGPDKGPCWACAGRERFMHARQESLYIEKNELDLYSSACYSSCFSLPPQ